MDPDPSQPLDHPGPTTSRGPRWKVRRIILLCLLILMTLPVGWLGLKFYWAARQRIAVARLREMGASILFADWDRARGLLGRDSAQVMEVIAASSTTDADLPQLAHLRQLAALDLSNSQITDAGLAHLTRLVDLQGLTLQDTKITDAGLAHLRELTKLERLSLIYELNLSGTKITSAGLEHLKKLHPVNNLTLPEHIPLDDVQALYRAWRDPIAIKAAGEP